MADTRITPKAGESELSKAGDPAGTTAAGLSTAGSTAATSSPSTSRAGSILETSKGEALNEAKQMVREVADEQRRRAAGAIGGMAGALHKAAGNMKSENEMIGRYTNIAAEQLDQVADFLRRSNWDDVLTGAEDMARRQPYWFVGGAMAAGFVLARMVKSSGAAQRRFGQSERQAGRLASASGVGYGTSTEAGLYPAGPATTSPIGSTAGGATGGSGATTPRSEV